MIPGEFAVIEEPMPRWMLWALAGGWLIVAAVVAASLIAAVAA